MSVPAGWAFGRREDNLTPGSVAERIGYRASPLGTLVAALGLGVDVADEDRAIRIVIADDHPLMLDALVTQVNSQPDLEVIATAAEGGELVQLYVELRPDVVLTDHSMPGVSGLSALKAIIEIDPDARVIVLSAFDDQRLVTDALKEGASGFLLKSIGGGDLCAQIRAVADGHLAIDPTAAERLAARIRAKAPASKNDFGSAALSSRELDVLGLAADGMTNTEIGERLGISAQTVKTYLDRVYAKLGVSDRAAAVRRAVADGVIT